MGEKRTVLEMLKKQKLNIDLISIKSDMRDAKSNLQRKKFSEEESKELQIQEEIQKLKSISPKVWNKIEEWGKATSLLTSNQQTGAWNIAIRLKIIISLLITKE